ncbi:hypothetical protein QCA50_018413 [Cerrena zonata]|uniref:Uncharacterized protein n=1 Tax=Cerrena zonata TaxID=2478898 RepID=A0AAW0FML0_9APHY
MNQFECRFGLSDLQFQTELLSPGTLELTLSQFDPGSHRNEGCKYQRLFWDTGESINRRRDSQAQQTW